MISLEEYAARDATGLGELVNAGDVTPAELAEAAERAVALLNPQLNAVLEVFEDRTGAGAGDDLGAGPFRGVPFFMKDLGSTVAGRLQESGLPMFAGYVAEEDSPLTTKFKASGVNIMGRSSVPTMGWTIDTTSQLHGITRSPWDLERSPGGSSGGTTALVSAGIAPISLASDGAGSLRIPAGFTGLVGLIGTRGRIPTPGMNEFGLHTGREGIVSRTVRDSAAMLDFMARHMPGDSFIPIVPPVESYLHSIQRDPGPQRIALSTGAWGRKACDLETVEAVRRYADKLADLGHDVVEVSDEEINDWEHFWLVFTRGGAWLGGLPYGEMAERDGGTADAETLSFQLAASVEISRRISAAEVREHAMANQIFNRRLAGFFERFDLLLCPTNAIQPPVAGGRYSVMTEMDGQEWTDNLFDAIPYTPLGNEIGIPAISLPAGLSKAGLPIGAQLYAPWTREDLLLSVAAQTEREIPEWFDMRPPLHAATAEGPEP